MWRNIRAVSSRTSTSRTRSCCDVNPCFSRTISSFRASCWWVSASLSSSCRRSPARRCRWASPSCSQWPSISYSSLKPFQPRPRSSRSLVSITHDNCRKIIAVNFSIHIRSLTRLKGINFLFVDYLIILKHDTWLSACVLCLLLYLFVIFFSFTLWQLLLCEWILCWLAWK